MSDEPRLPRLDATSAPESMRPTFAAFVASRGKVPNLYRVAAHSPVIATRLAALQEAVMGQGSVPVLLKELLSTRVSHINLCDY